MGEIFVDLITIDGNIKRTVRVIQCGIFALMMILSGCATTLTEAGHNVRIIHDVDPATFTECVRLGLITGESSAFLSGGDYGVFYATIDARNKTARIPEADTLLLTDNQGRRLGGEVTGIAYNCKSKVKKLIQKASPAAVPKDYIFEKAKKCQTKGGVWINNLCVIQIE